jgi:hypothetical protein
VKARIAVRIHSLKSNPIEKPTPRWQVVGQAVAGACPSRADQHRSTKAMTSGNVGHLRVRALEPSYHHQAATCPDRVHTEAG